jgi:spherulation-specific family 4 protein
LIVCAFGNDPNSLVQVIHNPGTPPDTDLAKPGPDITTVLEESFAQWQSSAVQERLQMVPYERARCAYMVHSVPKVAIKELVKELRHRGKYLFVTDLFENYYARFGSCWKDFVDAMQSEFAHVDSSTPLGVVPC